MSLAFYAITTFDSVYNVQFLSGFSVYIHLFCNKISVLSLALHKWIAQCANHEIKDSPVHLNC